MKAKSNMGKWPLIFTLVRQQKNAIRSHIPKIMFSTQKSTKKVEKQLFINYVIDVQYRHPATHIDRRDETKKMPLEVIFRKFSTIKFSTQKSTLKVEKTSFFAYLVTA